MRPARALASALVGVVTLAGCDSGLVSFGGDGATIDTQLAHPGGVVLRVLSVRSSGERTLVDIQVMNGRDRDIHLDRGSDDGYILTDSGERLLLIEPAANPDLTVASGQTMDGALVFEGALSGPGNARLVLNADSQPDNIHTASPRFDAPLPTEGIRGGGAIPDTSMLSGMRANPASRIGPAAAGGSTLAGGNQPASELRAVQALKSELGAVETDRGTLVSLPGDVTFDFDKSTIRPDARISLDRLAALIKAGGSQQISIEGHTDARGDDDYNKRLSEARAEAVKTYLVGEGIDAAQLRTIGLGELRPVAPNVNADGSDDEAGRQRNRRVDVILPRAAGDGEASGE